MTCNFPVVTVEEARSIDAAAIKELSISGLTLMENAARGICEVIHQQFTGASSILIVCGFGNNGGDGLALARLLAAEGIASRIYVIDSGRPLTSDAESNLNFLNACGVPLVSDPNGDQFQGEASRLTTDALIVDCLLGTGVQGDPRSPYAEVITAINTSNAQVLAVDVPSGLDANTGHPGNPTIKANHTVTFVGKKTGFQHPQATNFTGQISVAHIGLPLNWVQGLLSSKRAAAGH